jgi:hypothetical protein
MPSQDIDTAEWLLQNRVSYYIDGHPQLGDFGIGRGFVSVTDAPVPEPSSFALAVSGILGLSAKAFIGLRRGGQRKAGHCGAPSSAG